MAQYTDFIGMYQNVFPDGFCNHMIEEFERLSNMGMCGNRQDDENVHKHIKQDYFNFSLNLKSHSFTSYNDISPTQIVVSGLQNCFNQYEEEYDILKKDNLFSTVFKMQKTPPGGGYHIWHFEQGPNELSSRCLAWIAYLNTIEEAGETEFLYQRLRILPKENTMIIFPASFTHTHRGNVVHGNKSKYVITGWFFLE